MKMLLDFNHLKKDDGAYNILKKIIQILRFLKVGYGYIFLPWPINKVNTI